MAYRFMEIANLIFNGIIENSFYRLGKGQYTICPVCLYPHFLHSETCARKRKNKPLPVIEERKQS